MDFKDMPFGKHRGTPIRELETSYMQWLMKNTELREPLLTNIKDELTKRKEPLFAGANGTERRPSKPRPMPQDDPDDPFSEFVPARALMAKPSKATVEIRDYFAAYALMGLIANTTAPNDLLLAEIAYGYADAMLKARHAQQD